MDTRIELRKKDFKKTFEDPRRQREEQQVQIRKANREARLDFKRHAALATISAEPAGPLVDVSHIPEMRAVLMSNNIPEQFQACQQFRKLLSIEKSPPIQQVILAGVVPRFVEFLVDHSRPELQFEAAWALTNIASGDKEQTRVVVDNGAVPIFVQLLSSTKEDVREQAVWALGNIAGDCFELRDHVLNAGALAPLLEQMTLSLRPPVHVTMLRNATWTLSNLCRGKPRPKLERVTPALPVLRELIYTTDVDVLTDSCWALSYISDGKDKQSNDGIEAVLRSGVAARLVQLLCHQSFAVQTPALRTVGNIVSGNETQTQTMISLGIIPPIRLLLNSARKIIRREASWTISNIAAGSAQQIQEIINERIFPILITLSRSSGYDIQKEVYWALANAATGASPQQIEYLVNEGIIRPLCDVLDRHSEVTVVGAALEAIDQILQHGETLKTNGDNPYVVLIEEADGFPKLERLQYAPSASRVYHYAMKIMTKYMVYEEGEENASDFDVNYFNYSNGSGEVQFSPS